MLRNHEKDVTTIEIDLRLSTLDHRHGKLMKDLYQYLLTDKGKSILLSGWRSAGILDCEKNVRNGQIPPINPFSNYNFEDCFVDQRAQFCSVIFLHPVLKFVLVVSTVS